MSIGDEAVTHDECGEKNAASMQWGKETAAAVTAELQKVADVTERLNLSVEKQAWILSDPNVGIIVQTQRLALIVSNMKETQADHERRLNNYDRANQQAVEAKKPWQELGMGILKQVLWSALVAFAAVMVMMYKAAVALTLK